MARLEIVHAPNPVLKKKAQPVATVTEADRAFLDDMLETMYAAQGVGLAAPQVGVSKRMIVVDCARDEEPPAPYRMINPEIVSASEDEAVYNEGCLSLPEQYAEVARPAEVTVRWLDPDGTAREEVMTGLLATCVQHEIDHLNGKLFVDHLSLVKRQMILRKLAKWKREEAAA